MPCINIKSSRSLGRNINLLEELGGREILRRIFLQPYLFFFDNSEVVEWLRPSTEVREVAGSIPAEGIFSET